MTNKYDSWKGLDAGGREGLWFWNNPILWKGVLTIIAEHEGEDVYDRDSPIYAALEEAFPDNAWRSEVDGIFRPLFRDYPSAWTKTNTVKLEGKKFQLTGLGKKIVGGTSDPIEAILPAISAHEEDGFKPFVILATVFHDQSDRIFSLAEIHWGVVVGYRPGNDDLTQSLSNITTTERIPDTPKRRLRSMLSTLVSMGAVGVSGTGDNARYSAWNHKVLKKIIIVGLDKVQVRDLYEYNEDCQAELHALTNNFEKNVKDAGAIPPDQFILRLVFSLLSKRFLILTGMSGSGKTLFAKLFAKWICSENSQFAFISVGSNWIGSEYILGYADGLDPNRYVKTNSVDLLLSAVQNPSKPHFLLLDEMNLSHVERYFADFLSAIESPAEAIFLHGDSYVRGDVPPKLDCLPSNLFIIGTVNVDETTYMFSPKVLDRANVIEFRTEQQALMDFFLDSKSVDQKQLAGQGVQYAANFVNLSNKDLTIASVPEMVKNIIKDEFTLLLNVLVKHNLELGFRSAKEISRLICLGFPILRLLDNSDEDAIVSLVDYSILQKVLPRLSGSRKMLQPALEDLMRHLGASRTYSQSGIQNLQDIASVFDAPFDFDATRSEFAMSYEKLARMRSRLIQNGYTSFAEA